ncbi:hypothetical protein F5B20DRAFT_592158 [Whalleya microplaca]|nr:hypothetical protein F5B20DRAFT_592158 [Whalleya microplaca]
MPPKKPTKKEQQQAKKDASKEADPNALPASNRCRGYVNTGARFLCLEPKKSGGLCHALMKNGEHNISSHYTTQHKPYSAYQKKQSRKLYKCGDCGLVSQSFHQNESHHRSAHKMEGSSKNLHDEAMEEESEDDEETASDASAEYIPPADRRPDNDKDDRGPPPGIGGAQAVLVN